MSTQFKTSLDKPLNAELRRQDTLWKLHQLHPVGSMRGRSLTYPLTAGRPISLANMSPSFAHEACMKGQKGLNRVALLSRGAKPQEGGIINLAKQAKDAASIASSKSSSSSLSLSESLSLTPTPDDSSIAGLEPSSSLSSSSAPKTLADFLEPIIKPWSAGIARPSTKCTYKANTDDFAVGIKSLLFTDSAPRKVGNTMLASRASNEALKRDMLAFGKEYGVKIVFTKAHYYPRDSILVHPSGDLLAAHGEPFPQKTSQDRQQLEQATMKALQNNLKRGENDPVDPHPGSKTSNPFFQGSVGGTWLTRPASSLDNRLTKHCTLHYFEPGDAWYLSNRGDPQLVIGKDLRHAIYQQHYLLGYFGSFHNEVMNHLQTQLPIVKKMSEQQLFRHFDQLQALQLPEFKKYDRNNISQVQQLVAIYFSQMKLVDERIARTFSICKGDQVVKAFSPNSIRPVAEGAPHLDQNMTPGPDHTMLLDEAVLNLQILDAIAQMPLSDKDKGLLERLKQGTEKVSQDLAAIIAQQKEDLAAPKMPTTTPFPGNFFDIRGECNVLFWNPITGTPQKTGRPVVVLLGVELGDKLGSYLEDAMRTFWKKLCPEADIIFVGREDGLKLMNCKAPNGPHCQSRPLETFDVSSKESKGNDDRADSKKS